MPELCLNIEHDRYLPIDDLPAFDPVVVSHDSQKDRWEARQEIGERDKK